MKSPLISFCKLYLVVDFTVLTVHLVFVFILLYSDSTQLPRFDIPTA